MVIHFQIKIFMIFWEINYFFPLISSDSGITYRSLKYLSKDDIKDTISDIGLRAEFREKLFIWRKNEVKRNYCILINKLLKFLCFSTTLMTILLHLHRHLLAKWILGYKVQAMIVHKERSHCRVHLVHLPNLLNYQGYVVLSLKQFGAPLDSSR